MANDMLAPYQEHAQHAWESLQPGILAQDQALAPMLAHHFKSTGKLLRPALTLAFFDQLVHGQTTATPQTPAHVTQTALAIELLHNATLVHDDLQDGDTQRRGIPTVWKAFDAYQAINAGSALYFHALQQIANLAIQPLSIVRLQRLLASQTLAIIAGQALEKQLWRPLEVLRSIDTEALYLEVVQKKTSALFALPMMSAAILADIPEDATLVLEEVARPLGALFQIQDDILDLYGNKGRDAIGTDIAEGKPSFPALHALRHANNEESARLYDILRCPREETTEQDISWAIDLIRRCGALDASLQKMEQLRQQSLDALLRAIPAPKTPTPFFEAVCDKIMAPIHHLLP
ncbi:MAG: polyprenyl synthetase family protein [Myxococcales bacterium]|nr:polyprenyl synthetase family protein [Myxococcales bacterium]